MVKQSVNNHINFSIPAACSAGIHLFVLLLAVFFSNFKFEPKEEVAPIMVSIVSFSAAPEVANLEIPKENAVKPTQETIPQPVKNEVKKNVKEPAKQLVQKNEISEEKLDKHQISKQEPQTIANNIVGTHNDNGKNESTVVSILENPKLKHQVPPVYPKRAVERGLQGEVIVEAIVNNSGNPINIKIHKSSGFSILDDAATEAVKKWQFDLASVVLKHLVVVRVPVNFIINNQRG